MPTIFREIPTKPEESRLAKEYVGGVVVALKLATYCFVSKISQLSKA